jgi:transcription elongation factor Elf1
MNKKSTKPKKTIKLNATFNCPVCEKHRSKGDHTKCSRIMQLKNMKESGEI